MLSNFKRQRERALCNINKTFATKLYSWRDNKMNLFQRSIRPGFKKFREQSHKYIMDILAMNVSPQNSIRGE